MAMAWKTIATARWTVIVAVAASMLATPALAADKFEAKEKRARIAYAAGNFQEGVRLLAEVYNASNGRFGTGSAMTAGREYHTPTLLQNGQILIAGGDSTTGASAELCW